eukprot:TRINITY_DN7220_c0_g2_i2.p2 TRINITY_DN7220_c0_g2~~TRINITY_DN7220_c0_g2_i2.p2  ORF type:complete len:275 (-),score=19.99 TRINITY_DN7220_c0_g2_i2:2076-2834(-)
MLSSPLFACFKKVGNLCVQFVIEKLYSVVFIVDSACDLSQRIYCVMLLTKDKREELIQVSGRRLISAKSNNEDKITKFQENLQIDKPSNQHHRVTRSWDSPLEGLTQLQNANQDLDGDVVALDSYRSTVSSENEESQNSCGWSSFLSETGEVKSQSAQSENSCTQASTTVKKSTSFMSRISEDEETQNYIEDLQIQVSELMRTSSLVGQLQHRVEELEVQRDLLTRELLNTPKDLLEENHRLKLELEKFALS